MGAGLRRQAAIALGVWAIAFFSLAAAYAIPGGPHAVLSVDDAHPLVGQAVHFDASASTGHDAGNGRIVAYAFAFGDGGSTGWHSSPLANHAYPDPGGFTASLQVRDARGFQDETTLAIRVGTTPPPSGSAPDLVPLRGTLLPAEPHENASVTVSVTLVNRGATDAASATLDLSDLRPDGTSAALGSVSLDTPLAAGAATTLDFASFSAVGVGNHTLTVAVRDVSPPETATGDNVLRLAMRVLAGGTGPHGGGASPLSLGPLALGLAVAGVAAAAGAAFILLRPKPPGPLEPPPAQPPDRSPPPLWPP